MFSLKNHIIPKGSQTLSFGFEKQRATPKEELIFTLIYVLLSSLLALSKVAIDSSWRKRGQQPVPLQNSFITGMA